jgi:hypothetical protein
MSKSKFQDAYYKNFQELMDNLSIIRPDDISLMAFKGSVKLYVATYGVESLVETINIYVKDYKDKILKKDESFFFNELANDLDAKDMSFVQEEINKIKEIWSDPSTTKESKDIIWKHFTIFAKLSTFV